MRIEQTEVDSWIQPLTGKKGDRWPEQRTFHALLRGGELHRFDADAHVLVGRVGPGEDAHLITTTSLLEEELSADELKFIKDLLASWSPPTVWLAWLQRDTRMQQLHAQLIVQSGLSKVTRKKINGWAISVGVKRDDLEALIRG
ncbi:hypothetical protein [Nannocystis sp. SCPEA4]|uniref:hypothetical protein n=1 Tax=Nannocystis sp. SCPEA4 TaxID=2996787 RepID=UPI0022701FE3|nr:hypothetical protein [Nannocystis sp. SCPEA4]MCY1056015.1 hypothetical protein [Nannocystis sp. SCPEA4]